MSSGKPKRFRRWIRDDYFPRFLHDFGFLLRRVADERGEYDIRLRRDYFNLYYKGNSLARVDVGHVPYRIKIHRDFAGNLFDPLGPYQLKQDGKYQIYHVPPGKSLRSFFSKGRLMRLAAAIKRRNYSEETTFEQMLITDNLRSTDIIFIDRQVEGGNLGRSKIDLLALTPVEAGSNVFRFLIVEVKLGNNPELSGKVGKQLQRYIRGMSQDLQTFARCYEKQYEQFRAMGFLEHLQHQRIEIEGPVRGCVVVGGYSGLAAEAVETLRSHYPGLPIIEFHHRWPPEGMST